MATETFTEKQRLAMEALAGARRAASLRQQDRSGAE